MQIVVFHSNSTKFILKRPINTNPALVKKVVWSLMGDKPWFTDMHIYA